jgi:hypothetical protein
VLQHIGSGVISALLVLAMVAWSTRAVNPVWPAVVFAIGRTTISYGTGATLLTAVGTFVAAAVFGGLYFWLLQRTQGTKLWWIVLVAGVLLFSL